MTFVLILVTFIDPEIQKWQIENHYLIPVMFGVNLFCQCLLLCNRQLNRRVPINYLLLAIVTFTESYILAVICSEFTPESVLRVAFITLSAFIGLTFYANTTRKDLTITMGIGFGCSFMLLASSILMIFFATPFLLCFYSSIVLILVMWFIVFDIQSIYRLGKHGISKDDYIQAALILYLDVVNLFLHLLRLFGEQK